MTDNNKVPTEDEIQHELDSLHREMEGTRVRDGLKPQIYANYKERVGIISDMHRKLVRARRTAVTVPSPPQ